MRYDAIYVRQSLYREESISLETQVQIAKKYCTNEIKVYQDAGYSGKNTQRPQFQQLMRDVGMGNIDKVIVYRIDRFSRSILDFFNAWEILEKNNVNFVSATEQFDTSTPMGKIMLLIIVGFAEMERMDISARVTDNYYERAKRGQWPGGPAPMGYDLGYLYEEGGRKIPTLTANGEMPVVQYIMEQYALPTTTLGEIMRDLNSRSIPGPPGPKKQRTNWNTVALSRLIKNPVYVQASAAVYAFYKREELVTVTSRVEEFDGHSGCLLVGKIQSRGQKKGRQKTGTEKTLSVGNWEGYVQPEIYLKCQEKLKQNRQVGKNGSGTHTWLSGIIKCGKCGYALTVTYHVNKTGKIRKLGCSGNYIRNMCNVRQNELLDIQSVENEVEKELIKLLGKQKTITYEEHVDHDTEIRLVKTQESIQNLLEILAGGKLNLTTINYVNEEMERLHSAEEELLKQIQKAKKKVEIEPIDFTELAFEERKRVARTYIDKVYVYADRIKIKWKV